MRDSTVIDSSWRSIGGWASRSRSSSLWLTIVVVQRNNQPLQPPRSAARCPPSHPRPFKYVRQRRERTNYVPTFRDPKRVRTSYSTTASYYILTPLGYCIWNSAILLKRWYVSSQTKKDILEEDMEQQSLQCRYAWLQIGDRMSTWKSKDDEEFLVRTSPNILSLFYICESLM
jgi:hypothetical protein